MKRNKGITLIALVVTIIILIILAGIGIGLAIKNNGIIDKVKYGKEKTEEEQAREKLEIELSNIYIEKTVNSDYNENEYLTNKLIEKGYSVINDIVIVDGWQFQINRSVPKVEMSLGKGKESQQIEIETSVQYLSDYSKATINITINTKIELSNITINEESIKIPDYENNKYTITKEVENNTKYNIYVKDNEGNYKIVSVEITEITENMQIATIEELCKFRDRVNKGATFEGKTITIVNDIDLSSVCYKVDGKIENDKSWMPIQSFNGTFDGNNHTISNLYINTTSSQVGLFGAIEEKAIVKNVRMENAYIYTTAVGAAVITGINRGIIENVTVNSGTVNGNYDLGGIVGNNQLKIRKCINKANITYNNVKNTSNYGWFLGGIVGNNSTNNASVEKSINYGDVFGGWAVGGIVGDITYGSVDNCINHGKIDAVKNSNNPCAGGIAGSAAYSGVATISNSYNFGNISSTGTAGGILGFTLGAGGKATVKNCYNMGTITGTIQYSGNARGGIVGYKASNGTFNISNNYWVSTTGATYGIGYSNINTGCTKKTVEDMMNITTSLGDAYTNDVKNEDKTWKYNKGYPILKWQIE